MANMLEYYSKLRGIKGDLSTRHPSGCLFITSVANAATGCTAGTVAEVNLTNAAVAILNGNGRESTPEEVEDHQNRGQSNRALTNFQIQKERKSNIVITEAE